MNFALYKTKKQKMKTFKMKLIKREYSLILLSLVFASTSCNTSQEKSEEAGVPKMSIHEAAFMGNVKELKAHIQAKSDLNQKDSYGSAPLSIAALFGKSEIAKLLIEAGADVNVRSGDGSTPLHSAAFFCRTEIVKMLLDKGADISLRNNYGSTALESVSGPFSDVKPIYDQFSKDLGPLGFKLDYAYVEASRPEIAKMILSAK